MSPTKANQARTESGTRARLSRSPRWTLAARQKTSSARSAASPVASGRTSTSSRHASPHRASDTAPPTPSPAWPSRQRPGAQRLPSTHCLQGPKPLPSLQHTCERRPVRNPSPTKPSRQDPSFPHPHSRHARAGGNPASGARGEGPPPQHQSKRHSPPKLPTGPPKQSITHFALSSFSIRKKTLALSYEAEHSYQVGAAVLEVDPLARGSVRLRQSSSASGCCKVDAGGVCWPAASPPDAFS